MSGKEKFYCEEDYEEDAPIQISFGNGGSCQTQSLCLVGKVWTRKSFNVFGLLETMKKLWNPTFGMTCREIESNLFSFQFSNRRDLDRVLAREPWTFNKHVLVLMEAKPNLQPSAMKMDCAPFWIRLYDIPMAGRGEETLTQIGSRFGKVLEIDKATTNGLSRSVRLKILLNLGKVIRKGTHICLDKAAPIWLPVKYERLPSFCYMCGQLDHNMVECDKKDNSKEKRNSNTDEEELPFGEWLRASPLKQTKVVVDVGYQSTRASQRKLWYNDDKGNKGNEENTSEQKTGHSEHLSTEKIDEIALTMEKVTMNKKLQAVYPRWRSMERMSFRAYSGCPDNRSHFRSQTLASS